MNLVAFKKAGLYGSWLESRRWEESAKYVLRSKVLGKLSSSWLCRGECARKQGVENVFSCNVKRSFVVKWVMCNTC